MPLPSEWGDAFLQQAKADLIAAETLVQSGRALSPACMMLQMVFEKLAKAYRLRGGESYDQVKNSHETMGKFIKTLEWQSHVFKRELGSPPEEKWSQWLDELKNLEKAQPSIAKKTNAPQLEYPWTDNVQVFYPERDLPLGARLMGASNRLGAELLRLAHTLVRNY